LELTIVVLCLQLWKTSVMTTASSAAGTNVVIRLNHKLCIIFILIFFKKP